MRIVQTKILAFDANAQLLNFSYISCCLCGFPVDSLSFASFSDLVQSKVSIGSPWFVYSLAVRVREGLNNN